MPKDTSTPQVLIVGAGPIGLTAACFLNRLGVPFDIIDSKNGPVDDSRALGVHARTLEFMQMFGLDKTFIKQGRITRFMSFHRHEKFLFKLDFGCIADKTDFPFMLVLPQSKTERILTEYLEQHSILINWKTHFISLEKSGELNHCKIRQQDTETTRSYQFVIAADGANSKIRTQLGIPFEGQTYDARFLLSEAKIENNALPRNSSHVFMGNTSTVAVLPQPDDIYRIVGPDFQTKANGKSIVGGREMTFKEFEDFLNRENLLQHINIKDAKRLINYRIHKRMAKFFRKDNVFLCGDAAHIHSPAGGQGMNTGIHDVMNLCWKIAAVLQGAAKPEILESYESERVPAVKAIIDGADQAMLKVVNRSWWWRILLDNIAPIITQWYQPKHLMATMGQLSWSYSTNEVEKKVSLLEPGHRLPNYNLTNGLKLHQILGKSPRPIIIVSGADLSARTEKERIVQHTRQHIQVSYHQDYELVNPLLVRGAPFIGSLVVRPDGYLLASVPYLSKAKKSHWTEYLTNCSPFVLGS